MRSSLFSFRFLAVAVLWTVRPTGRVTCWSFSHQHYSSKRSTSLWSRKIKHPQQNQNRLILNRLRSGASLSDHQGSQDHGLPICRKNFNPCAAFAALSLGIVICLFSAPAQAFLGTSTFQLVQTIGKSAPLLAIVNNVDHESLLLANTVTASTTPTVVAEETVEHDDSTLDEVWALVDKYYVNKKDIDAQWKSIRNIFEPRYNQLVIAAASIDEQLKPVHDMVATLGDKYSRVITPSQYVEIQKYDLLGIGVTLMPKNGKIVVGAPPIVGSSAAKAELRVGDQIIRVNGVPTDGKTALDIVDQVSAHPDDRIIRFVVVPVAHAGDDTFAMDVTMDRSIQTVSNPITYHIDKNGIAYIRIAEFNSLVLSKLEEALTATKQDAVGYVIDLRHNTGGAFQSAVEIASLFLNNKVATYVVDNGDQNTPFKTTSKGMLVDADVPVVIWMDDRSASASEVLASSLHDNCRAMIAGSRSFGKGLIQAVYGLKNGAGLILTVARYVTPAGIDIQGTGISPDIPGHVSPMVMGVPMNTDSSFTDWTDVKQRLAMCQVPS